MKRLLMCGLLATFCLFSTTPAMASAPTITLDGQQLHFDVAPINEDDRVLVPMRTIFEALGAIVAWNEDTQEIMAAGAEKVVKMQIGNKQATVNGIAVQMDIPARIVNSRTMVPLRFISENMDCEVIWDSLSNNVIIEGKPIHINKTYYDSSTYIGTQKHGQNHGNGVMVYANGDKYDGEWKNNRPHGQGTFIWASGYASGDKYVGGFADGNLNGQGTYYFAGGDKYVGELKNGLSNGQGTYSWAKGSKYIGEFKNGLSNGYGTYYWANGSKYVGTFLNDMLNGPGTFYAANGDTFSRYYNNDILLVNKPNISTSGSLINFAEAKAGLEFQYQEALAKLDAEQRGLAELRAVQAAEKAETLQKQIKENKFQTELKWAELQHYNNIQTIKASLVGSNLSETNKEGLLQSLINDEERRYLEETESIKY